jgi:hypothetical protein
MTSEPQSRDEEFGETAALLLKVPGGSELLEWMNGIPNFGDAEVVSLVLDRAGQSQLRIRIDRSPKRATITFTLEGWIDVAIHGFSHQNVVGGLKLRPAREREIEVWERGVGCTPGELEIELEPCFGAYGTVRANVRSVAVTPLPRLEWIDAEFCAWAAKLQLKVSRPNEVRKSWSVHLSSIAGECFRIWIEPAADGKIGVRADYVEGPKNPEPTQSWTIDDGELRDFLREAYRTVNEWMAPSSRYFPPVGTA